jgi:uncharacterized protein YdiU (UPF0061 family)
VAPSWLRFGNFEIFFARDDKESIKLLADYTMEHFFPDCKSYTAWATKVVELTAIMVAKWQAVGFCHGVMNTDNFSVLGLTIDYGPFQFLDQYDPLYICNHSDETGRYAFMEQPRVALWNLLRFCNAISHLLLGECQGVPIQEKLQEILGVFTPTLQKTYNDAMCQKLGIAEGSRELMDKIVHPLLVLLEEAEMDYTLFFRTLSKQPLTRINKEMLQEWKECSYLAISEFDESKDNLNDRFSEWSHDYYESVKDIPTDELKQRMLSSNPKFILRNHIVQTVIEKTENRDVDIVDQYLKVLQKPFDEHSKEDEELFGGKVPKNKRDIKCSCSS